MSARDELQPLPAWIAWPIRVLAVIFVVPFKLAWDLLVIIGRFVGRYLLKPLWDYVLRPVLYYVVWLPVRFVSYYLIWVPLRWVTVTLLWRPLVWLTEHVFAPFLVALWRGIVWFVRALRPFWRLLGRVLLEVGRAVGWAMRMVYHYLLRPLALAVAFVWLWVVVPVGKAIRWAWNHSVVLLWRYLVVIPVSWVGRTLVVPPARWVRAAILHPIAETTRSVLVALGLREPPRRPRRRR